MNKRSTVRSAVIALLVLLIVLPLVAGASGSANSTSTTQHQTLPTSQSAAHPDTMWGFGASGVEPSQMPVLPGGSTKIVRLWDNDVTWAQIEPARGQFVWDRLDAFINGNLAQGKETMLTLGMTPAWAAPANAKLSYMHGSPSPPVKDQYSNDVYWTEYVDAVIEHCKGRVAYYEPWNEPEDKKLYFNGTPERMVELSRIVYSESHRIDPAATVLSPGFGRLGSPYFDKWLTAGGTPLMQGLSFHPYGRNHKAGSIDAITQLFRDVLKRHHIQTGLWATEIGWFIADKSSPPLDMSEMRQLIRETFAAVEQEHFAAAIWYPISAANMICYETAPDLFKKLLERAQPSGPAALLRGHASFYT